MNRWIGLYFALVGSFASAQEPLAPPRTPAPRVVEEDWQAASIDGQRSGYVLFTVHEYDINGQKIYRGTRRLVLNLRRFGDIAKVEAETGTDETADGTVTAVFMRQGLGKNTDLIVRGTVVGNKLNVTAEGKMRFSKVVDVPPKMVGAYGEYGYVGKIKPAPGTEFDYVMYEPFLSTTVKVRAKAEGIEQVPIAGQKPYLLKVVTQPLKLDEAELPASTFWYDNSYKIVKTETVMPGVGRLILERTTKEDALRPCVGPDLGWRQSIKLKQRLQYIHDAESVTYRIKVRDQKPETILSTTDGRQSIKAVSPGTIDLTVTAIRNPSDNPGNVAAAPGDEYLTSNNFITSDDSRVRQHAAAAIGQETDPLKKARLIERWVHTNMRVMNFTEAMAPAAEVAKTLSGDCTEYSMLTAAMCRAVGVPARTALGMVYVDARDGRQAMLAMHMWTEVYVGGHWLGLDATLGRGSIGPAHIKVSDQSWMNQPAMTPLLPLMRLIMSEPEVEIVKEQRGK